MNNTMNTFSTYDKVLSYLIYKNIVSHGHMFINGKKMILCWSSITGYYIRKFGHEPIYINPVFDHYAKYIDNN